MTSATSSTEDFRGTFEHQVWVGEQHSSDHLQSIFNQNCFNRIYTENKLKPKNWIYHDISGIRVSTAVSTGQKFIWYLKILFLSRVIFSSNLGTVFNANVWVPRHQTFFFAIEDTCVFFFLMCFCLNNITSNYGSNLLSVDLILLPSCLFEYDGNQIWQNLSAPRHESIYSFQWAVPATQLWKMQKEK